MKTNIVNFKNEANEFGYAHNSTIKLDIDDQMKFEFNINEFEPNKLIKAATTYFKPQIESWLISKFDKGVLTNGGCNSIEEWFGMGSYALMELGLKFNFHYSYSQTVMTIST
jgi:hypothetical protein